MSRGYGELQQWIMETLRDSEEVMTAAELQNLRAWATRKPGGPSRSICMSVNRALLSLEAANEIKRDKSDNWRPAKGWTARENKKRQRIETAYHEAGHAVIGLAGQVPVSFVTIVPRRTSAGHVQERRENGGIWRPRDDLDLLPDRDAFGNKVRRVVPTVARLHASIRMSIAGPMAEAEFRRGSPLSWRAYASKSDLYCIKSDRFLLGKSVGEPARYESETLALLRKFWPMIEAVAVRLLKDGTLSGSDIDKICIRIIRKPHLARWRQEREEIRAIVAKARRN